MFFYTKSFLTLMLSTFYVLSIYSQYFVQKLFEDVVQNGEIFSLAKTNNENEYYFDLGVFYSDVLGEKTMFYKSNTKGENLVLRDFKYINQWSSSLGESIKFDGNYYYYLTRDVNLPNLNPDSIGWNFGKLALNGDLITSFKIPFKPKAGSTNFAYGLELVKNNEVIVWGAGNHPEKDPTINDPYIIWVRLKKDGTLVSGPHYYKPPAVTTWAHPTDATLDIDSLMVMIYDSKHGGKDKYVLKIREDDTIENMVYMPLGHIGSGSTEDAKLCVTKNGHFMVVNYDTAKDHERILTRVNRENEVVWQKSFDLPQGIVYGFQTSNVSLIKTKRIIEARNGDILMCGVNAVIDSFFIPNTNQKILTSNRGSSYIARFSKDGELLWRHFLVDLHDDGTLNFLVINDMIESEDGNLIVAGSIGVKNEFNRWLPFYMKLGPNGCFDDRCSHVNKWWYLPEEIVSDSEQQHSLHTLALFPNPGKDQVNIILPKLHNNEAVVKYAVSDVKGQTHIQGTLTIENPTVSTQFLPSGIYIISIQDSEGILWHGKWIKE